MGDFMSNKYVEKQNEYLNKFGEHSLDNVIIPDLLHDGIEGMEAFFEELEEAIKLDCPIKQNFLMESNLIVR